MLIEEFRRRVGEEPAAAAIDCGLQETVRDRDRSPSPGDGDGVASGPSAAARSFRSSNFARCYASISRQSVPVDPCAIVAVREHAPAHDQALLLALLEHAPNDRGRINVANKILRCGDTYKGEKDRWCHVGQLADFFWHNIILPGRSRLHSS